MGQFMLMFDEICRWCWTLWCQHCKCVVRHLIHSLWGVDWILGKCFARLGGWRYREQTLSIIQFRNFSQDSSREDLWRNLSCSSHIVLYNVMDKRISCISHGFFFPSHCTVCWDRVLYTICQYDDENPLRNRRHLMMFWCQTTYTIVFECFMAWVVYLTYCMGASGGEVVLIVMLQEFVWRCTWMQGQREWIVMWFPSTLWRVVWAGFFSQSFASGTYGWSRSFRWVLMQLYLLTNNSRPL